uniref:Protein kinase domain-containing protein n=1 Tax=Anisakis simplex TaxID=6269 RepID=A0A0M3KCA7_ANISI
LRAYSLCIPLIELAYYHEIRIGYFRRDTDLKNDTSTEIDEILYGKNTVAYHLERFLGRGGYGEVYECRTGDNKTYALKRENIRRTHMTTEVEGIHDTYMFVVMSLLGKDLSKLRKDCPTKTFSLGTALRLGIMTLSAIKELHEISIVSRLEFPLFHRKPETRVFDFRDIKPSNFAIGRGDERRNIFLFDFGLSRVYKNKAIQTNHFKDGSIIPPSANAGFKGTTRYASIRAHQKKELGRSDDLESWLYVNVEFSTGRLPWKSGKGKQAARRHSKERTLQMKKMIRIGTKRTLFFKNCPQILDQIFAMIDALEFESEPPYDQIKFMFEKTMLESDVRWIDAFDWESGAALLPPPLNKIMAPSQSQISTYAKSIGSTYAKTSLTASTQTSSIEIDEPLLFQY